MHSPNFIEWIKTYGVPSLAVEVGVCKATIYNWIKGKPLYPRHARVILHLAQGTVEAHEIKIAKRRNP